MLRLLGILALGNLLFGGRHHRRRALRRGLLFGAILGFLAHNGFDTDRMEKSIRKTAKDVKKTVKKAAKEARKAAREQHIEDRLDELRAQKEARKAERDQRIAERLEEIRAEREARKADRDRKITVPVKPAEAQSNEHLVEDLERHARTATMAADVPVIHFPEDDPKYNSSRKYGYA